MKNSALVLILFSIYFLAPTESEAQSKFYYSDGDKKTDLVIHSNIWLVNFTDKEPTLSSSFEHVFGSNYRITSLELLEEIEDEYTVSRVIGIGSTDTIYESDEIIVKYKSSTTSTQIIDLAGQYDLTLLSSNSEYYRYRADSSIEYSVYMHESELVEYSHPNFIVEFIASATPYIPNDTYFSKQYYLHNTGQAINDGTSGLNDADMDVAEAWDISKGDSSIVVAVIDDGITPNHPDLPNSRQAIYPNANISAVFLGDTINFDSLNPTGIGSHGNSCAGIIAASQDNNLGISGIAPNSKIMPVVFNSGTAFSNVSIYADAINFAQNNNADIISGSFNITTVGAPFPVIEAAISSAVDDDVLICLAAGNTRNLVSFGGGSSPDTLVLYPANTSKNNVICIGASDRNNLQAQYSPFSRHIDIVAPSSSSISVSDTNSKAFGLNDVWTMGYHIRLISDSSGNSILDTLPDFGTDSNYFTGRFGGTSAATPMIAGVAALMRSVNPCLGQSQVKDLLLNTASKVGGYNYNWNSAMPGHSKELGYGVANAHEALKAAQEYNSSSLDLMIRDVYNDFGEEPDNVAQYLYLSEDIWVRNSQDGITNQFHENPIYHPTNPVYVYVRVRNKSCADASTGDSIALYWSKAATALSWPDYWNGSITSPALMGDSVATKSIGNLKAGHDTIIEFEWNPPNPTTYSPINSQPWHFCLLGRILSTTDTMTYPEDSTLWINVKNNNNIAWKNLTVVNKSSATLVEPELGLGAIIAIGNDELEGTKTVKLNFFESTTNFGNELYEDAEITIKLSEGATTIWQTGGSESEGLDYEGDGTFLVTSNEASLSNMTFSAGEREQLYIGVNFLTEEGAEKTVYHYHVEQFEDDGSGEFIGGEMYLVHRDNRDLFTAQTGANQFLNLGESFQLSTNDIGEQATYNWYDKNDSLIYSGKDTTISPTTDDIYTLEVIAHSDGFKDYSTQQVLIKEYYIKTVYPSPNSNGILTVEYEASKASNVLLQIVNASNNVVQSTSLNTNQNVKTFNLVPLVTGTYQIKLVCDGIIQDTKNIIIN